jgi:hypothetical protein
VHDPQCAACRQSRQIQREGSRPVLRWSPDHRVTMLVVALGSAAIAGLLGTRIGQRAPAPPRGPWIRAAMPPTVAKPASRPRTKCGRFTPAPRDHHRGVAAWKSVSANLACLWRDQGKCNEARDLLAPVYSWSPKASTRQSLTVQRRFYLEAVMLCLAGSL